MIVTEIYNGQGLGNQLWCYVTTRVIALDKGYDFGIKSPEKLKCSDFMQLDCGKPVIGGSGPEGGPPHELPEDIQYYYNERRLNHPENGVDIRTYDSNLVNIPDKTKIDGIMQDEKYISHRKAEIRKWLRVNEVFECNDYASDDTCVINFRGGEYVHIPKVFLPKQYWEDAVQYMLKINPNFRFVVITDDVQTAKKFFPSFEVHHFSIAKDYVVIKNASYLILSNSSFACLPAWLNENLKFCIAPKYWSQYNTSDGYWGCSYNLMSGWHYLDRSGQIFSYEACVKEHEEYMQDHLDYYVQKKIERNFLVISNFHNDISWIPNYTSNYIVYDKSTNAPHPPKLKKANVVLSPNVGYNLYDYFTFIIDNYDKLPACTIFAKGNVFPRHVSKQYFERIMNNEYFTPIEDYRMHKEQWPTSFFSADGGFCELNTSWYLQYHPTKYFSNYNDFLAFCFKEPVFPRYIRFAPGANYIVPRANILKYPKVLYENLRTIVSHAKLPGEAHIIERALYTLWTSSFQLNDTMLAVFHADSVVRTERSRFTLRQRVQRRIVAEVEKILTKLVI
jgi:hypothetical protein